MPAANSAANRYADLIRLAVIDSQGVDRLDEGELQASLGLPRRLVRAALHVLVDQGYLRRARGSGTATLYDVWRAPSAPPHFGVSMGQQQQLDSLHPSILAWEMVAAPKPVAGRLTDVSPGEPVLCIDYQLCSAGEVLGVYTNYMRMPEARAASPELFVSDFYAFLDDIDARMHACDFVFYSSMADRNLAVLMAVVPGTPVMRFEQTIRNERGEAFDFAFGSSLPSVRFEVPSAVREQ
jgi:DNA-binding GntR family transcriptional regulator